MHQFHTLDLMIHGIRFCLTECTCKCNNAAAVARLTQDLGLVRHACVLANIVVALQPGDGGLQLLPPDGVWREVAPPPGTLLINVGNLLARWTNGRWQSTMHRVTNPPQHRMADSRRSSVAFFHKVNTDAIVSVLPTCINDEHPCAFEPRYARELSRQGVLWRHRHLPAEQASAMYHRELDELRQVQQRHAILEVR